MLLVGSISGNFYIGRLMGRAFDLGDRRGAKTWLVLGVAGHLAALFCFKYVEFFVTTVNHVLPVSIKVEPIQLPLAVSFFTFQQIAYLVEVHRGQASSSSLSSIRSLCPFFPIRLQAPLFFISKSCLNLMTDNR